MTDPSDHQQMVLDCQNRKQKLWSWECESVDLLAKQLTDGTPLTGKQSDELDEIWERATK